MELLHEYRHEIHFSVDIQTTLHVTTSPPGSDRDVSGWLNGFEFTILNRFSTLESRFATEQRRFGS